MYVTLNFIQLIFEFQPVLRHIPNSIYHSIIIYKV